MPSGSSPCSLSCSIKRQVAAVIPPTPWGYFVKCIIPHRAFVCLRLINYSSGLVCTRCLSRCVRSGAVWPAAASTMGGPPRTPRPRTGKAVPRTRSPGRGHAAAASGSVGPETQAHRRTLHRYYSRRVTPPRRSSILWLESPVLLRGLRSETVPRSWWCCTGHRQPSGKCARAGRPIRRAGGERGRDHNLHVVRND